MIMLDSKDSSVYSDNFSDSLSQETTTVKKSSVKKEEEISIERYTILIENNSKKAFPQ
jgi:hypothetical protein